MQWPKCWGVLFHSKRTHVPVSKCMRKHLLLDTSGQKKAIASPLRFLSRVPTRDKRHNVCVKLSVNKAFCWQGPFVTLYPSIFSLFLLSVSDGDDGNVTTSPPRPCICHKKANLVENSGPCMYYYPCYGVFGLKCVTVVIWDTQDWSEAFVTFNFKQCTAVILIILIHLVSLLFMCFFFISFNLIFMHWWVWFIHTRVFSCEENSKN